MNGNERRSELSQGWMKKRRPYFRKMREQKLTYDLIHKEEVGVFYQFARDN